MPIMLYDIPGKTNTLAAYNSDTRAWETFPAVQGGYDQRAPWAPSKPLANRLMTENQGFGLVHRAYISEIPAQARWLGLPEGATVSKYADCTPSKFRVMRETIGMTQEELAQEFGCATRTISSVEKGESDRLRLYYLALVGLTAERIRKGWRLA